MQHIHTILTLISTFVVSLLLCGCGADDLLSHGEKQEDLVIRFASEMAETTDLSVGSRALAQADSVRCLSEAAIDSRAHVGPASALCMPAAPASLRARESSAPDARPSISHAPASSYASASRAPGEPLQRNFVLYGYKQKPGDDVQIVFDGYAVRYQLGSAHTTADNTHDYSYVEGLQTIKYWDYGASEYNFWAYTGDKSHFQTNGSGHRDGTILSIPDLTLSTTEPDVNTRLFSKLYHRSPVTRDVVRLEFMRPYAKVRLLFYTTEEQTGDDQIHLTDIHFGGGSNSILHSGAMTITYPKTGSARETITVTAGTSPGSTRDYLSFNAVTLDATHGTTSSNAVLAVPSGGTDWYYTLPLSTDAIPAAFTLTLNIDDDPKAAMVPAEYMHWKPNTCYTYIFKITEAGKKIEIHDVLIDPWHYGGSQAENWTNW